MLYGAASVICGRLYRSSDLDSFLWRVILVRLLATCPALTTENDRRRVSNPDSNGWGEQQRTLAG